MPKTGIRLVFDMETRNKYNKVDCEIGLTVDGRELPNASVLGSAMEEAVALIQDRVKKSYEVVPPRAPEVPAQVTNTVTQPTEPAPIPVPLVPQSPVQPEPVAEAAQAAQVAQEPVPFGG